MDKNFNNFAKIWLASLMSAVGSGFTGYGLSVWIYMQTGEVSKYSLISVVTVLPGILIGFFAGVLVDFVNRKKTMLICDFINGALTFLLLGLLNIGRLELWHIYIILSIVSTLSAIRWSAYVSSIVLTVEDKDLKRANGMDQFTNAASQIFPPIFAALMVNSFWGVSSVIFIDALSYVFSIIMVGNAEINYTPPMVQEKNIMKTFREEFIVGLSFLKKRKALIGLLAYMAMLNYISGGVSVLFSPMILSFASKYALSLIMAVAGVGMVFGSLVVVVGKRVKLNTDTILRFSIVFSIATIVAGAFENIPIICIAGFVFFSAVSIVGSAFQYVFQRNVPAHLQGRVFAIRKTIVTSTLPISYLSLGFLADYVFIPFVNSNKSVSALMGSGNSRGIGLLLMVLGLISIGLLFVLYYKLDIKKLDNMNHMEEKMERKSVLKNVLICLAQVVLIIAIYKVSMLIIETIATPIYHSIGWLEEGKRLTVTSEFTVSNVIAYSIGILIALGGYCAIVKCKKSNIISYTSLNKFNRKCLLLAALFGFCVNTTVMYVMMLGQSNEALGSIYATYIASARSGSVWVMLLFVGFLIPVFEEMIYRGLIFNLLKEYTKLPVAIVLQAALFVVFEMLVGGAEFNIIETLYGFAMAVIFALFYVWSGSLWTSICARAFKNLAALIIVAFINEQTFIAGRYFIMTLCLIGIVATFTAILYTSKSTNKTA